MNDPTADLARPLARLQFLAAGVTVGGLLLGTILLVIGITKTGVFTLTFNVGLLLILFGWAGARIFFLARELTRPAVADDAKHRLPVEDTEQGIATV